MFEPQIEIYGEAALMADELGLPPDWFNDGVKGLLPDRSAVEIGSHFATEGISVGVASVEYLFAMKAYASRGGVDADDLRFLAQHLGLRDAKQAIDLVERFYEPRRLKPVTQYLLEDLFADLPSAGDDPV